MKKVLSVKPYNHKSFYNDQVFKVQNGHNAFYGLTEYLKAKKIDAHTCDLVKSPTTFIYADMPYPWRIDLWLKIILSPWKHHVLFVFESPLINPFNRMEILQDFFDKIYTWSSTGLDDRISQFYIPQIETKSVPQKPFDKKRLLVVINANKRLPFPLKLFSPFYRNLYKDRVKAINTLQRIIPFGFDLYGKGWEGYASNKGTIKENGKLGKLSEYKFCLCYENAISKGYVTEKVFDCFKSGVVPIYLGAPNISELIPTECFIDMRNFSSYTQLVTFLLSMDKKTYLRIQKNAAIFLQSKEYKKWSQQNFFELIYKELNHA